MGTAEQTGQDEETIRAFVSRYIRGSEWRNDEDMFELGLVNSLFAMQLVMFVEKEFGVTVEDEDLEMDNFRSVDAIAGFVRRKRQAGVAPEL
jgi:acyl carrier protein